MTIRRAAGFIALGSFVAMIALIVLMVVQIVRQPVPEQGDTIGFVALTDPSVASGINLASQPLAVLDQLQARWDIRNLRAVTYESMEGMPVVAVMLRRPLSYSEAIDLDAWIRDGGHALILAEPGRSWPAPSDAVEADRRDVTWGLRLSARTDGPFALPGGGTLLLRNAGRWIASGECSLQHDGFLAECRPGKGRVVLVGDTGLLDRSGFDMSGGSFESATGMIGGLVEALERDRPLPDAFIQRDGRYAGPQPPMMLMMAMGGLFWLAVGALAVWAILLGMAKTSRERPTGPARIVRDPTMATSPARVVHQPAPPAGNEDPVEPQ